MATASPFDDLQGAELVDVSLHGARFVRADLSDVVMRAVDVFRADVDAPWLADGGSFLVNGVDVVPLVKAELDRRFPGRAGPGDVRRTRPACARRGPTSSAPGPPQWNASPPCRRARSRNP